LIDASIRVVVEVVVPSPDEVEAWRRRQMGGLRRFLEAVRDNRQLSSTPPSGGNVRSTRDSYKPEVGQE
jgi:hypothetical protein